jgi:hypothetical protein
MLPGQSKRTLGASFLLLGFGFRLLLSNLPVYRMSVSYGDINLCGSSCDGEDREDGEDWEDGEDADADVDSDVDVIDCAGADADGFGA